jgi:hypothetical protein
MPESSLQLVKKCAQWQAKESYKALPRGVRGVYALHNYNPKSEKFDVVYVGMAAQRGGVRTRLGRHFRSKSKEWTHFSLFEVWDNVREEAIDELEGLFREIYRKDSSANRFNRQRRFKKLQSIRVRSCKNWNGS